LPDYVLMQEVLARQKGWISRYGHKLETPDADGVMKCPESGFECKEIEYGVMKCLDLDENKVLPEELSFGRIRYSEMKLKSK